MGRNAFENMPPQPMKMLKECYRYLKFLPGVRPQTFKSDG